MSDDTPRTAITGRRVGHVCDQCNATISHGDPVRGYATYDGDHGWLLRRLWCDECGPDTIDPGTEHADEVLVDGLFVAHRLVAITIRDRDRSASIEKCGANRTDRDDRGLHTF